MHTLNNRPAASSFQARAVYVLARRKGQIRKQTPMVSLREALARVGLG